MERLKEGWKTGKEKRQETVDGIEQEEQRGSDSPGGRKEQ